MEELQMAKTFKYDSLPAVETTSGKLRGYFFDKTYVFKGIPYAQAKRFQMPEKVTPWEGEFEAASYGMVCPMLTQDEPRGELFVPHRYWPQSEHCQNLNIWTKSLDKSEKKPVLVWFHGGGFSMGSAIEHIAYDGVNLCADSDLVVVSVNHRLNILGYLDMESLDKKGGKYKNSANAGHADMVMALEWVRDNIGNFGGDPENVTIFGQSGGGIKCTGLMQIPAADGLFHKAIIMSGVSDGMLMPPAGEGGQRIAAALLEELGLSYEESEKLEEIPYYELAKAYNKVSPAIAKEGGYIGCAPMANDYYKGEPLIAGFTEHAKTIPFLVGTVFGEFAFGPLPVDKTSATEAEITEALTKHFGPRTPELVNLYKSAYLDKHIADLFALDRIFRPPTQKLAMLAAKEGKAPAYMYQFALEFPYKQNKIAWHCSDIPFFFGNTDKAEVCNIPDVSDKLEAQMVGAVKAFAYTGDPNHKGIPNWPAAKPGENYTMIFDRICEARCNFDDELISLLSEISPKFRFGHIEH